MNDSDNSRLSSNPEITLTDLPQEIALSLSPQQRTAVQSLIDQALTRSKSKPKLVDLRFEVDLFVARYYFVLLVGQDQRAKKRRSNGNKISRFGNRIAAILLLISFNLLLSSILLLIVYLLKSLAGIDLFPGHLGIQK
jgi:hypothetical protein